MKKYPYAKEYRYSRKSQNEVRLLFLQKIVENSLYHTSQDEGVPFKDNDLKNMFPLPEKLPKSYRHCVIVLAHILQRMWIKTDYDFDFYRRSDKLCALLEIHTVQELQDMSTYRALDLTTWE